MNRFIVELSDEWDTDRLHKLFYEVDAFPERIYPLKETWERADGTPRMTTAQRDKLWDLCGRYNVPFREDDYYCPIGPVSVGIGYYEGWVGGPDHSIGTNSKVFKPTIYVGVEPNGDSHS